MPAYVPLSLIALLFFTATLIIYKINAKASLSNPYSYYFYYNLIYVIFGLTLPFFTHIDIVPKETSYIPILLVYGILINIAIFSLGFALFKLDVSVISPLANLTNVFIPVTAFILLGERLLPGKVPWIMLVIFAGIFTSYSGGRSFKSLIDKNILYYLVFILCLSFTRPIASIAIERMGYWNFNFYNFVYLSGMAFFVYPFIRGKVKFVKKPFAIMACAVFLEVLGLLFMMKAYTYQVIVPTIITSIPLGGIVVFIISRFKRGFLEDHPLKVYLVRFSATAVMVLGVIMVTV